MEASRKSIGEMFGDAFRETAVLVIVLRERAQDRKRNEEEARRNQPKAV
jgi:hypothetical protein